MEGFGLTITLGLTRLIIPIGLVAIAVALILIGTSARQLTRPSSPQPRTVTPSASPESLQVHSSVLERISVGLCALLALGGAIALVTNVVIREDPVPHPLLFFLAVLGISFLLGAPALMWSSRWRVPAEGLATVGVAVVAVVSGFSIGFAFVPLLVAMLWVCVRHLTLHSQSKHR